MGPKDPDALDQNQADAILSRAIELQHASDDPSLSLTDIEAVARELGVEPRHVQTAAAELARPAKAPNKNFLVLGAPTRIVREHTLEGPPQPNDTETVFDLARQHTGDAGRVKKHGGALTWRSRGLRVTVLPQKKRSRVLVTRPMGGTAVSLFVPILIPSFLAILGLTIPLGIINGAIFSPIFFGLLGFAAIFQMVRMIFANSVKNKTREVSELMSAIAANTERERHTLPPMSESQSAEVAAEAKQTVKA